MKEKPISDKAPHDFRSKFSAYTDEEIIRILKKRDHYQKAASEAAVQEAIKRGIIHTEHDLRSAKYKVEPMPFTLFPKIENETVRLKTLKSINRSLLILGAVPAIWGALKMYRRDLYEGLVLLFLGVLWVAVSFQMMKTCSSGGIKVLLVIFVAALVYVSRLLWANVFTSVTDVFITVLFCLLVLYGLLYVRKLG